MRQKRAGEEDESGDLSSSFIKQIDQLKFPKRGTRRRSVYVDEQIKVELDLGAARVLGRVIDISPLGLSVVVTTEESSPLPLKGEVEIVFSSGGDSEYRVEAIISNLSKLFIRGIEYVRVGLEFKIKILTST